MPLFEYIALDTREEKKTGFLEAKDVKAAKLHLFDRGLILVQLKEMGELSKGKISFAEHAMLARQLSLFLKTGFTLDEAFENAAQGWKKSTIQKKLYSIVYRLKEGKTLEQSLMGIVFFPDLFLRILTIAEKSGQLPEALETLALYAEKKSKFSESWIQSLLYPAFLFGVSLLVLFGIFQWVFPTLMELFKQWDKPLPWTTRVVLKVGQGISNQLWLLILIVALVGYGARQFYRKNQIKCYSLLFRLPFFGSFLKRKHAFEFSRNLALLLSGGVQVQEALALAGVGDTFLEKELSKWKLLLEEGKPFDDFYMMNQLFPQDFVRMLSMGFKNGKLKETCERVADFYERDLNKNLNQITTLIGPIFLLLVGAFIGFIVIGVILPIFEGGI